MTAVLRPEQDAWLADTADAAGYGPDDAVVMAVAQKGVPTIHLARGRAATDDPVRFDTVVYTASLSKQVTAACAALLVTRGTVDVGASLSRWMPELPSWASTVTVHDLVHHTSGLPDVLSFEELRRLGRDRTSDGVRRALEHSDHLVSPPGSVHSYCNAGYVCLATVIERAADQPLADVAAEHLFRPLSMSRTRFWSGPGPHPPAAAPTEGGMPTALSLGDGGMWSTTVDLLRWNEAMNGDELGISALLQTPGRLQDGTPVDYAWGIGVRTHAGQRVYRHGGLWAGLSVQLVRVPDRGGSAVVMALDHDEDRTAAVANAVLGRLST